VLQVERVGNNTSAFWPENTSPVCVQCRSASGFGDYRYFPVVAGSGARSLVTAETERVAGRLSDWISLGVLASRVPRDEAGDAVEATGKAAKRRGGKLPPQVTVYFVTALAPFADEDCEEVWARLTETLAGRAGAGSGMTRRW
jgi:Insertion element 4 transposase N-terminal